MDLQKFLKNYECEVFRKRIIWTMARCLMSIPFLLILFIFVSSFQPFQLTSWLSYNALLLISWKFWFIVLLNVPLMMLLVLMNASKFQVMRSLHPRRVDTLAHAITSFNLMHYALYTFIFFFLSFYSYSIVLNEDISSQRPPTYNRMVMSLCMGGVMATVVVVRQLYYQAFVYSFSEINIRKVDRFKAMLKGWVVGLLLVAMRMFVCVHVFLAFIAVPLVDNFFKYSFAFLMTSRNAKENDLDDVVYPFFSTQYLYANMCLLVCLQIYVYVPVVMHNIHFTETIEMVVCKRFESGAEVSLCDSINNHSLPLIRYLAYLNLKDIAMFDVKRRAEIFSLSKPGKRPVYWQAIMKDTTQSLQTLIKSINQYINPPTIVPGVHSGRGFVGGGVLSESSAGILTSLNQPFPSNNKSNNNDENLDPSYNKHNKSDNNFNTSFNMNCSFNNNNQKLFSRQNLNTSTSLLNHSSHNQSIFLNKSNQSNSPLFSNSKSPFPNNKNIFSKPNTNIFSNILHSLSPLSATKPTSLHRRTSPQQQQPFNNTNFTFNKNSNLYSTTLPPVSFYSKYLSWLMSSRFLSYWCIERVDVRKRMFFVHAQSLVWMVKGLSLLVAHSFMEDSYGVVQGSLVDILVCLMTAYESLNKPLQLNSPNSSVTFVSHEAKVRNCLRNEVKSALYRITFTFKDSLKSLDFTAEQINKLSKFRNFVE